LQEIGGLYRLAFTQPGVAIDVQARHRVRYSGHGGRIAAAVADRERDRRVTAACRLLDAFELQLNVQPHALDRRIGRAPAPQIRIQVEPRDHVAETRAAHHFLLDRLNPCLQLGRHRLRDVGFRHLLPLDQYRRGGAIQIGQRHRHRHAAG
jgi:hypothetical protein